MIRAYYHLVKPGIVRGNLLAVAAGFLLASPHEVRFGLLGLTLLGVALVIASGCVANNILDRDIDAKMARTKKRALVTGDITVSSAIAYAAILGLFGATVLYVRVGHLVGLLGVVGWIFYVIVYGYAKRVSTASTFVGTVSGSMPMVAGYVAVVGRLDMTALILFVSMASWQMAHFYAIAIFRHDDYAKAGLPVLSVAHGAEVTIRHIFFFIALFTLMAPTLAFTGIVGRYYLVMTALIGLYWLILAAKLPRSDPNSCAKKVFGGSLIVLLAWCFALAIGPRLV